MFKAIYQNKIIAINETGDFPCLVYDTVEEDIEHSVSDYRHYDGEFTLINIAKENEQAKINRANAYANEVDCITAHIQRLRDVDGSEEEINALIAERTAKIEEIKQRYPYLEE